MLILVALLLTYLEDQSTQGVPGDCLIYQIAVQNINCSINHIAYAFQSTLIYATLNLNQTDRTL